MASLGPLLTVHLYLVGGEQGTAQVGHFALGGMEK